MTNQCQASLSTSAWMNAAFNFVTKSGNIPKLGTVVFRASLMIVDAQVFADPCFMKERANAIQDSSVSYISLFTWR